MKLPIAVRATLARFVERYPVPNGVPGEAIEDAVRQWTNRAVEQVVYENPGKGWGSKRADANRPQSKDGIANNQIMGGKLLVWDLVTGAGTGSGSYVGENSDAIDITGQVYIGIAGVDHLFGAVPAPVTGGGEPSGSAFASFDQDVRAAIGRVEAALAAVQADSTQLRTDTATAFAGLAAGVGSMSFSGTVVMPSAGKAATFTLKAKK